MGRRNSRKRAERQREMFESLEGRVLLSAASLQTLLRNAFSLFNFFQARQNPSVAASLQSKVTHPIIAKKSKITPSDAASVGQVSPAAMRHAYGVDQIMFGDVVGDGSGQTIAIIDAYHYSTAVSDLQTFNSTYGLPQFNVAGGPTFTQVGQNGGAVPGTDPAGPGNSWAIEEALDVEWAHVIAPKANILLVEASSTNYVDLVINAAGWARNQPGVSVVSMSFGGGEFAGEETLDAFFQTPAGHAGVTFVASTGDTGSPGGYPSYSPNVVAVGGTTLSLTGLNYASESGWSGSGGGESVYASVPSYQVGNVGSASKRATPDVSMDADLASGVPVLDTFDGGWFTVGGTSLAAPIFAALIAIANQGRALAGAGPLDGTTQTLPRLYQVAASDFHDVTTGNNGKAAGVGYDEVTGRGTPIANLLVADLVTVPTISGQVVEDDNSNGVMDGSETGIAGAAVYIDSNNNGVRDTGTTVTASSGTLSLSIPDNNYTGVTSSLTIGSTSIVSDVNIKFSITHPYDSDLAGIIIAPDGTQVTVFSSVGGSGNNFTNTILDDQAATSLSAGTVPFNGTFKPNGGALSVFNGKVATGVWKFKIVDGGPGDVGKLTSWSLTVTTSDETQTTTDGNGNFTFGQMPFGNVVLRQVVPGNFVQITPVAALTLSVQAGNTPAFFGDFPTVLGTGGADAYYVRLDASKTYLEISNGTSASLTPTYRVALAALGGLTFNLGMGDDILTFDYVNNGGTSMGNFTIDGGGGNDELRIVGASPAQVFGLTDSALTPPAGSAMGFSAMESFSVATATVNYAGDFVGFQSATVAPDATFNWL